MRPRFDLRVAVGRNLTLTSLSLPLTRQDHDKTPVAVGGHLRALDMWIGRNAIHGSTFWSSRSRRKFRAHAYGVPIPGQNHAQ